MDLVKEKIEVGDYVYFQMINDKLVGRVVKIAAMGFYTVSATLPSGSIGHFTRTDVHLKKLTEEELALWIMKN